MNRKVILFLISVGVAVSGFSITTAQAASKTYNLSFSVISSDWSSLADNENDAAKPSECYAGKYSRLNSGAILKVTNQNGKLLAIGKTVWKVIEVTDQGADYESVRYEGTCALVTTVKKLPKADIYQLMLGTVDAGAYTFKELVADKWMVILTYG